MEDNSSSKEKSTKGFVNRDPEDDLNQFFTLIYFTNPMTHYIKIWVASSDARLYMRQDRFIEKMCELVSDDIRYDLESSCSEYGGWYFLDRKKKSIKHLNLNTEDQRLTPKELLEKTHCESSQNERGYSSIVDFENIVEKLDNKKKKFGLKAR